MVPRVYVEGVLDQEDSLALALVLWLDNERLVLEGLIVYVCRLVVRTLHGPCISFELRLELHVFYREYERLWEEVILTRVFLSHLHQITSQLTFVGYYCDSWKLRNSLVWFQLRQRL